MAVTFGSCYNERSFILRVEHSRSIIFQPRQIDFPFSVSDILFTVIINKKAGIIQPLFKLMHRIRTFRPRTLKHDEAIIRNIDSYIINAFIISDGRGPAQTAISRFLIFHPILRLESDTVISMTDNLPINQIFRMTDRNSRHCHKGRTNHIIILPYTDNIRIRIIGINHRIGIGSVTIIGGKQDMSLNRCTSLQERQYAPQNQKTR